MPRKPLTWPFGGRQDTTAFSANPELFTRFRAQNVRVRDPRSGTLRGASRAGLTKWNETAIGTGRVRALCSTAFDRSKIQHSFSSGAVDDLWSVATPSKTDTLEVRTDRQGNVYAIDGPAGIVKINSAGREVMKIALPVADANHVVRALWVDEIDRIFAGVSAGGDVRTARVWCVLQLPENEYQVLWQIEPGAYTEALRTHLGSQLFAAHNYPLENRARILVYEGIGLAPREESRIESVAYPIHDMDVLDGQPYTASGGLLGDTSSGSSGPSGIQQYRPGHPAMRGHHPPITAWTPLQLEDAHKRIHSWYDAADIDETDLDQTGNDVATVEDGQLVLRWRDKSGNNRHWYAGSLIASDETGPAYAKVGPGGLPALRFTNVGTTKQSLVTDPNGSISKSLADQQRTAIPAHEGAMWAMFMLIRPTVDDVAGTDPRVVFYAENDATSGTPGPHGLWTNRACGAIEPGTFGLGSLSYFAKTDSADDGGCATADQAVAAGYTNSNSRFTDCALVTILWDGGIDPNDTTKTRCLVRVNGRPYDRFEGLAFQSLKRNYLGYAPSVATAVANRLNGEVCELLVIGRRDRFDDTTEPKVLTHDLVDFTEDFPAGQAQTDHELARIESYMAHRRGLGHLLGGAPGAANPAGLWPHFYGQDDTAGAGPLFGASSPPDYDGSGRSTALEQVLQRYPLTTKHDGLGKLVWVANEETHPDTGANRGGIGYGVRARKVESDGKVHVWLAGPDAVQATTGDVAVRKIIDTGPSFSGASADGAWRHAFSGAADFNYAYPRMAADKFGVLFVPGYHTGGGTMRPVHAFQKDPDGSGNAQQLFEFLLPGSASLAHAVALPPDALTPEYRGDLAVELAEHVYVATKAASLSDPDSVHKLQLVTVTALASGSPREVITIGIVEDDVKVLTAASAAIPTGGTAAVSATAQYVEALRAGEDIVILDGTRYLAYSLREGTVAALESTSGGELPPRAQFGMYWRHRLMLAGFPDNPSRYVASKLGDIRDWDFRITDQTATQAFEGTSTRAGEAEDGIVALIPAGDDLAFIMCQSRILRLSGDPMDNGVIHKVTDSMGGCFGKSWCKDDKGRIYFFGNPFGLYMMRYPEDPLPLSEHTLAHSEFQEIDLSTHRIELVWDPLLRAVHIFRIAWATSTIVDHWCYEESSHALVKRSPIWTDRINSAEKQPTAFAYLGGDDSRAVLVGCADGYVRMIDPEATSDDGTIIDAYVTFDDLVPNGSSVAEFRLTETEIALAHDQGGVRLELFASENADELGPVRRGHDLIAGGGCYRGRVKGAHVHLRLRSASLRSWAFESGHVDLEAVSEVRSRAEVP